MTDVLMPQMGESIAEGTITKWMKSVGDRVERDEPLFEISTDKVDAEIPSPEAGILAEIRHQPGETVEINTVVAVITGEGESAPAPTAPAAETKPAAAPAPAATPPAAPATSPTAAPSAAPAGGPRSEMSVEELRRARSSPVVRRIAAEHGVDISTLAGTGISGRVTKQDILGHIERRQAAPASAAAAPPSAASPIPAYLPGERVDVVPMSARVVSGLSVYDAG